MINTAVMVVKYFNNKRPKLSLIMIFFVYSNYKTGCCCDNYTVEIQLVYTVL